MLKITCRLKKTLLRQWLQFLKFLGLKTEVKHGKDNVIVVIDELKMVSRLEIFVETGPIDHILICFEISLSPCYCSLPD